MLTSNDRSISESDERLKHRRASKLMTLLLLLLLLLLYTTAQSYTEKQENEGVSTTDISDAANRSSTYLNHL
jgi:hypothetical protein